MSRLPRLRIRLLSDIASEDTCSLEEAETGFDWGHDPFVIVVENQAVGSYLELVELAQEERFKDSEFLDVELQPILIGG